MMYEEVVPKIRRAGPITLDLGTNKYAIQLYRHGPKYEFEGREFAPALSEYKVKPVSPVVRTWPLRSRIAYYLAWPYMRLRYRYPLRP